MPTAGDRFGAAVAVTDFFGFSPAATVPNSLAIGIPGRDVGGVADAGAVDVLSFAAATGAPFDPRLITQDSPGVGGAVEPGAGFGTAVAFGYAGGSQRWLLDLLAGAPGSHAGGGAVVVVSDRGAAQLYGGAEWTQDTPGVADTEEAGDGFGAAITYLVDSFNLIGTICVGSPGEDVATIPNFGVKDAGAVHILQHTWDATGPHVTGDTYITQNSLGVADSSEPSDHFGAVLDNRTLWPGVFVNTLIVGIPDEDVGAAVDAGAVQTFSLYATPGGGDQLITAATAGVPGAVQAGAHFGAAVGGRTYIGGDLLIGVPDGTGFPGGAVVRMPTLTLAGLATTPGSVWTDPAAGRYGASISSQT